ncbi:MAG: DUF6166 domain-containing protein [Bdellovibrionales bacterium]
MKIYHGIRKEAGTVVTVTNGNVFSKLSPRFDLRNHSPTGFEWGYGGSGPAQLSLAILADHFGDDRVAQEFYQNFKFRVIGRLTKDEWTITARQIDSVIQELKESEINNG